jgi:DNA-binding CsgD family transcriptional regulator
MQNFAISSEELKTLLKIISDLLIVPSCMQRLNDVIDSIHSIVPFQKCLLVHKEDATLGKMAFMREYVASPEEKSCHVSEWRKSIDIQHFLAGLTRTDITQNAFRWKNGDSQHPSTQELDGLLKQITADHGIAGIFEHGSDKSDEGATLLLLQYSQEQFSAQHLLLIESIMSFLHSNLRRHAATLEPSVMPRCLTAKEAQVIGWVSEGKTSWEVSQILLISERTVKFHLKNIYTKFNVVNRAQAVSVASRLRLTPSN